MNQNTSILNKRFLELEAQMEAVAATKKYVSGRFVEGDYVDNELFLNWKVKTRNLLSAACGENSEHYRQFLKSEQPSGYQTNFDLFKNLKAVFYAAKEDFEGGYLKSLRNLVHAEVFGSELEQAEELLASGYVSAAAVIAGVVLETALREMCEEAQIPTGKLDRMNSDLAKSGAYNRLMQKRITTIADIRNNAAHGNPDQFTQADVSKMISDIESFLADHL